MKRINILSIGFGRGLFAEDNSERRRMRVCADAVSSHHMIIFSSKKDNLHIQQDGKLTMYPTNSSNKIMSLVDAFRLGRKIINEQHIDVITTQDPFETALVGLLLSRFSKKPINIQEHGDFYSRLYWMKDSLGNPLRYVFGLFALKRADSVRVVADRIKNTLIKKGVSKDKILSLPVRSDAITAEIANHQQTTASSVVIVTVCRLVRQKNIPMLINAFESLHCVQKNVQLKIVGSGPEEVKLKKIISDKKLGHLIEFVPWTDNPLREMVAADIFALSSNWEGWGRVLIEAMYAGVPIVTTDVGCANEVVIDGKHGFVVPVDDVKLFSEKLIELSSNASLRKKFGLNASQDVTNTHVDAHEYSKMWAHIFSETLRLSHS